MKSGKILNPKTGRYVLRTGSIGLSILKKKCAKQGKTVNPKTGRCIKGKAKKLERVKNKPLKPKTDNINSKMKNKYGPDLIKKIQNLYALDEIVVFNKKLGTGAYGDTYIATVGTNRIIVKIQKVDKYYNTIRDIENEYRIHQHFADKKMFVPQPYFLIPFKYKNNNYFSLGMQIDKFAVGAGMFDKLLETKPTREFLDYVIYALDKTITALCRNQLIHGDLHWGNIGFQTVASNPYDDIDVIPIYDSNGRIVSGVAPLLIDFGLSSKGKCNPDLEIAQLLRTLSPKYMPKVDSKTRDYLYVKLIDMLEKYGKYDLPLKQLRVIKPRRQEFDYFDKLYEQLHKKYLRVKH